MQILVYGISNQKGGISEFMMNLNKNMLKICCTAQIASRKTAWALAVKSPSSSKIR